MNTAITVGRSDLPALIAASDKAEYDWVLAKRRARQAEAKASAARQAEERAFDRYTAACNALRSAGQAKIDAALKELQS